MIGNMAMLGSGSGQEAKHGGSCGLCRKEQARQGKLAWDWSV